MISPNPFSRETQLRKLQDQSSWDILVIGGGATGLGIALDAASRGYKTLLVEQCDFAKGTSSRSTKLIHGGVRYLAQGNLKLVRQASIERALLRKNAPHLVKDQTFVIPIYKYWDLMRYTIGLKLYDWISGGLSLGSSVFISRKKTIAELPGILTKGLKGGVLYHDGQFDDSRLALNLAQTIVEHGGCVINYLKVVSLLKNERLKTEGAILADMETDQRYTVKAKAVINATGVFVDDIHRMDDLPDQKTICASQGIHLVLDKKFFPSVHALMIPETSDGRVLFVIPWHDKIIIGTTDTPVNEISLEPIAMETEIGFVLNTASCYLSHKPQRSDVLSVFAGLRPLAAPAKGNEKTKEISRDHKILISSSNLFTMLGGKWTTYRKMGEDMVDRIEKYFDWPRKKSLTATMSIHGYAEDTRWDDPYYFYGADKSFIKEKTDQALEHWLSKRLHIHPAQVQWAIENEMARTVEDFLSRRTRALILDAKESLRICPEVARIMAGAMDKNEEWISQQIAEYSQLASHYILKKL